MNLRQAGIAALAAAAMGCGPGSEFVGEWDYEMFERGTPATPTGRLQTTRMTISADGTYEIPARKHVGRWSVQGNYLVLTANKIDGKSKEEALKAIDPKDARAKAKAAEVEALYVRYFTFSPNRKELHGPELDIGIRCVKK